MRQDLQMQFKIHASFSKGDAYKMQKVTMTSSKAANIISQVATHIAKLCLMSIISA